MGACLQAPHATPRQRLMEMHHVSLILFCISVCFYDKSHRYVQIKIENDNSNNLWNSTLVLVED